MADQVSTPTQPVLTHPPAFCEYAGGQCDQNFEDAVPCDGLFLYPSEPELIAVTIRLDYRQPIDYRDVMRVYSNPKAIPDRSLCRLLCRSRLWRRSTWVTWPPRTR